jgi:beta-fructofuranosidase
VWECPQLLSVSGRDLLVVSVQVDGIAGPVVAATARRGQPFGSWQRLVHGSIGYATSLFLDRDGRPAMLSWLREQHPPAEPRDWAGAESVVAILDVAAHGGVVLQPHPAVADAAVFAEMPLPGSPAVVAEEPATPQVFTAPPDCAVDLRVGIGGTEALALATTPDRSGLIVRTAGQIERLPASAPEAGLRLFLDGDLAELFWAGSYGAWRLPG